MVISCDIMWYHVTKKDWINWRRLEFPGSQRFFHPAPHFSTSALPAAKSTHAWSAGGILYDRDAGMAGMMLDCTDCTPLVIWRGYETWPVQLEKIHDLQYSLDRASTWTFKSLNMVIFHSCVGLPEGRSCDNPLAFCHMQPWATSMNHLGSWLFCSRQPQLLFLCCDDFTMIILSLIIREVASKSWRALMLMFCKRQLRYALVCSRLSCPQLLRFLLRALHTAFAMPVQQGGTCGSQ